MRPNTGNNKALSKTNNKFNFKTMATKEKFEHAKKGTKVDTATRVEAISTGKNKHLPKEGKSFKCHPAQLAYFENKGYAKAKK